MGGGHPSLTILFPGKKHLNAFTEGWLGHRTGLVGIKKKKSLLSTGVSSPYDLADSTLCIPTALSRPLIVLKHNISVPRGVIVTF